MTVGVRCSRLKTAILLPWYTLQAIWFLLLMVPWMVEMQFRERRRKQRKALPTEAPYSAPARTRAHLRVVR